MPHPSATQSTFDLTRQQLFLDDTWIADSVGIRRVWHQATKYADPVLTAEHPWEHNCPVAYGSVLKRGGLFQMWYCGWTRGIPPVVCYAESADGIRWHKPKLGIHEVCGTKDNNVVMVSKRMAGNHIIDDLTVIDDPEDDKWPLKALYWDSAPVGRKKVRGIWAARSKDGIHWEDIGDVLPEWGDRFNAMSVKHKGKYILLGRQPGTWPDRGRVVSRIESSDLKKWSKPELVLKPDPEDRMYMQYYSATAFPYGDILVGSIERMFMTPDKLDTEIIWSRDDGHTWQRSRPRPSFIEWGTPGRWDDTWINLTANGPIVSNGQLWFYYSGRSGAHGAAFPHNQGAIGLATLRLDGFCSLRAPETSGWFITPAMTWPGDDLYINADVRRDLTSHPHNTLSGSIRVEAVDAKGKPIKGFTLADCTPYKRNSARSTDAMGLIRWAGDKSLHKLKGKRIQLKFEMADAHLYAFKSAAKPK